MVFQTLSDPTLCSMWPAHMKDILSSWVLDYVDTLETGRIQPSAQLQKCPEWCQHYITIFIAIIRPMTDPIAAPINDPVRYAPMAKPITAPIATASSLRKFFMYQSYYCSSMPLAALIPPGHFTERKSQSENSR